MDKPSTEWTDKLAADLAKFILKGRYKDGVVLAKRALKKYPNDLVCLYQYAKLLGDWADELPPKRRKKLKVKSARILRPLTKRLAGRSLNLRFGLSLNYYYQSYAFRDMYAFGGRFLSQDRRKGLYAQALGAGLLAEEKYRKGKVGPAKSWAKKSNRAWEKYNLKDEPYYFAHYSYAKSLALAEDVDASMKSLKKAARLSRRPITNWEFEDVLEIIERRSHGRK